MPAGTPEAQPDPRDLAAAVDPGDYNRLLGMPRGRALTGDLAERADEARRFYAKHGDPWVAARRLDVAGIEADGVVLEGGTRLGGRALAKRVREEEIHALAALAVTAGARATTEARRLWAEDRPDEAFFVERFATAVVEQLVRWAKVQVCRAGEARGETALFHLSPGCGGWDLGDQPRLMALLAGDGTGVLGPLTLLDSGMLSPAESMLAMLALTRRPAAPGPADACRSCDLTPCAFRRAPCGSPR